MSLRHRTWGLLTESYLAHLQARLVLRMSMRSSALVLLALVGSCSAFSAPSVAVRASRPALARKWHIAMNENPTEPKAAETNAEVEDGSSGIRQLLGFKGAGNAEGSFLNWKIRLQLMKPGTWVPLIWGVACGAAASGNYHAIWNLFGDAPTTDSWGVVTEDTFKALGAMLLSGPLLCGFTQTCNDWFDRDLDGDDRGAQTAGWHDERLKICCSRVGCARWDSHQRAVPPYSLRRDLAWRGESAAPPPPSFAPPSDCRRRAEQRGSSPRPPARAPRPAPEKRGLHCPSPACAGLLPDRGAAGGRSGAGLQPRQLGGQRVAPPVQGPAVYLPPRGPLASPNPGASRRLAHQPA
jgi:hypothetical protein